MATTALAKAIRGDKVTERQAKGALSQAVSKIARLSKSATKNKENLTKTGETVIHTAELQGSLFLASLAEGYLGDDKMKIGEVDVRAPVGLATQVFGLYQSVNGDKNSGHALAFGNGVLGSWIASVGVRAGKNLASRGKKEEKKEEVKDPNELAQPQEEAKLGGPIREVLLSPEPEVMDLIPDPEQPRRFVRATQR